VIARYALTAAAGTLALAACGPAVPPLPRQGGPAWREYTSEHFTLWSDTTPARAHVLMRDMEDLRHAVIGIAFHGGGAGRVLVIALRDEAETKAFMPGDFKAMASDPDSNIHQPLIMIPADSYDEVVAHELTHTISQTVIRDQPRWFAEGLAKYFETIAIDRERGTVDLGRAPTWRGDPMVMSRLLPLRDLVRCTELVCADRHFYASAWALFTYLMNVKHADVASYIQTVPASNLDELEAELKRWLVNGSHTVLHYNMRLPTYPVTERDLADADVDAIRALLRLEFQGDDAAATTEANAALALDPTHVLATFLRYRIDKRIDVAAARAVATAHPDDWRAQMLLAWALHDGDEAGAAFKRACELAAQNPALVTPCSAK
jgi:hypothetical protein